MGRDEEKARLRREVLAARDGMEKGAHERSAARITSGLLSLDEYKSSGIVLGYCSFGSEPDTDGFLGTALRDGKSLVLPRVDRTSRTLSLHEVANLTSDVESGIWGILEPRLDLPQVSIVDVDFVLIPGVAFDRKGGRLGYGGGYYDRLIAGTESPPMLAAAAFGVQIIRDIPIEGHDAKVDLIVTDEEMIRCDEMR